MLRNSKRESILIMTLCIGVIGSAKSSKFDTKSPSQENKDFQCENPGEVQDSESELSCANGETGGRNPGAKYSASGSRSTRSVINHTIF